MDKATETSSIQPAAKRNIPIWTNQNDIAALVGYTKSQDLRPMFANLPRWKVHYTQYQSSDNLTALVIGSQFCQRLLRADHLPEVD